MNWPKYDRGLVERGSDQSVVTAILRHLQKHGAPICVHDRGPAAA